MEELGQPTNLIRVKPIDLPFVISHAEKIKELFAIQILEKNINKNYKSKMGFICLPLEPIQEKETLGLTDIVSQVQNYVDKFCRADHEEASFAGEDSSYDSDYEAEDQISACHPDICRTESDTLKAEYAEYFSDQTHLKQETTNQDSISNYTSRVEFGLKLGYPEYLVQAALQKLGPEPGQNELLEELVKLGAQTPHQELCTEGESLSSEIIKSEELQEQAPLRPIVIDGSNVAMSHGNKEIFSCRGIKICVDWFRARGHKNITVFVPKWRKETSRPDHPIKDQELLTELEKERILVFTPSRLVGGKRMVCYDDRYTLKLASEIDGIVVSNDNYRDLIQESPEFRKVVEEKILMYSFVNDRFMPPDDPLGRSGPTLDMFLRVSRTTDHPLPCPYGKKCTYGNKCKFHHPERGLQPHKSVTDRLVEYAQKQLQARGSRDSSPGNQLKGKSLSLPLPSSNFDNETKQISIPKKNPLVRTKSNVPASYNSTIDSDSISSVAKSKSVENVTESRNSINYQKYQSHSNYERMRSSQSGNQSNMKNISKPDVSSEYDNSVNLHRKLQRQLTLNPTCDPRLYHMGHYINSIASSNSSFNPRRNLKESSYKPPVPSWDPQTSHHQNVTRIASAPDGYRIWPTNVHYNPNKYIQRSSSTSDPQLNLCVQVCENSLIQERNNTPLWPSGQNPSMIWQQQQQPCLSTPTPLNSSSENVRLKLHYHLAAIFPEEQVQKAMQLYPEETNPEKICAAILTLIQKP